MFCLSFYNILCIFLHNEGLFLFLFFLVLENTGIILILCNYTLNSKVVSLSPFHWEKF